MFRIELFPARRGDCIWVEYGDAQSARRILIDGGLISTCREHLRPRIEQLPEAARRFELLVVTHIDLDHIAGILELLEDPPKGLAFGDVWFNGYNHLIEDPAHVLGPLQGEAVSALIKKNGYKWNAAFQGQAVAIPDQGPLTTVRLDGGMALTLLSPTTPRLRKLSKVWEKEVTRMGLEPGKTAWKDGKLVAHPEDVPVDPGILGTGQDIEALAKSIFHGDKSEANGSSIAFLAEHDGKAALFMGDAYATDTSKALGRLFAERHIDRLPLDALKLSHHGGRKNTSSDLLKMLETKRFLLSTDGSIYKHPDRESVARALVQSPRSGNPALMFNYRTPITEYWADEGLRKSKYAYGATYPQDPGLAVEL